MNFLNRKYLKFGIVASLYLAWVIWLGNFWFLPGIIIIYDLYVSKKVNWTFWKKREGEGENSAIVEWIDALIFAVVAVTFINIFFFQNYKIPTGSMEKTLRIGDHLYVSKMAYGPKLPNTPLSFPFTQNIMPLTQTTKSYLEWIQLPYKRLKGFGHVKRDDNVVFNFPAGDTVVIEYSARSFDANIRAFAEQFRMQDLMSGNQEKPKKAYHKLAEDYIWNNFTVVVRPVDRRDNYIKRCVGLPGDSLFIEDGQIYINGKPQPGYEGLQFRYNIFTDGSRINPRSFERLDISHRDILSYPNGIYEIPLTKSKAAHIKQFNNVRSVEKQIEPEGQYNENVFPHSEKYPWNQDNFGPLHIPYKGQTIELTLDNLPLYRRIIDAYEGNSLLVKDSIIVINGEPVSTYTIQMDYYFMMGDNRHDSADSRFWGFVPEDHIVGRPVFIWLSLDQDKRFLSKIRLNRMFKSAKR